MLVASNCPFLTIKTVPGYCQIPSRRPKRPLVLQWSFRSLKGWLHVQEEGTVLTRACFLMSGGQATHYSTSKVPGPTSNTADEQAEAGAGPLPSGKAMGTFSFLQIVAMESSTHSTSDRKVKRCAPQLTLEISIFIIIPYCSLLGLGWQGVGVFLPLFMYCFRTNL